MFSTKHCNMKYVTPKTLHHPYLNGKSAAQIGGTMEKHFCRVEPCAFMCTLCVIWVNPHLLRKCDYMACMCVAVFSCVGEWLCVQLGKCRSGWEYKLGQNIKSCVSCWSSFTRGTARSLNFPAFQLVYSGTCQDSPPFEKPSACR